MLYVLCRIDSVWYSIDSLMFCSSLFRTEVQIFAHLCNADVSMEEFRLMETSVNLFKARALLDNWIAHCKQLEPVRTVSLLRMLFLNSLFSHALSLTFSVCLGIWWYSVLTFGAAEYSDRSHPSLSTSQLALQLFPCADSKDDVVFQASAATARA